MKKPQLKVFQIAPNSEAFTTYYNKVQEQLETLATMDDLLSGEDKAISDHIKYTSEMYSIVGANVSEKLGIFHIHDVCMCKATFL